MYDLRNHAPLAPHTFQKTNRVDGKRVIERQRERTVPDIMKKLTLRSEGLQETNSGTKENQEKSLKVQGAGSKRM